MSDHDGHVEGIWVTDEGSAPMERREQVRAVEGGIEGDRYQRGTGYYSGFDGCEVTLIAGEAIDTIEGRFGIDCSDGRHRRNVVTRDVSLATLLEHRFRIGEAVLEGTRPRPPCFHLADVGEDADLPEALGDDRGGICAAVVDPGPISVGDPITVLDSTGVDADAIAASIRDRYE
jgi:MOSC domain-containing protein YiiM